MSRLVKCCIYMLVALCCGVVSPAVAATRTITDQQWHELARDPAFSYRDSVEHYKRLVPEEPSAVWTAIDKFLSFFNIDIIQILFWCLVGLVAVYIIYKLFLANDQALFGRKEKGVVSVGGAGDDIASDNWEALLQRAINNNDLQQAVRYSYMWLLHMLQEAELIRYREDKTNFDYYKELRETAYKQSFRQLSRQYEYVIYGNYHLSATAYNQYIDLFNQVKRQLGK